MFLRGNILFYSTDYKNLGHWEFDAGVFRLLTKKKIKSLVELLMIGEGRSYQQNKLDFNLEIRNNLEFANSHHLPDDNTLTNKFVF